MNIYTKDMILTGSQDTTVKSWSLETGDCLKTFHGHIGAILCLAMDSQGKILFTGSGDNSIRVWDIQRATELRVYDQHQGAIIHLIVSQSIEHGEHSCVIISHSRDCQQITLFDQCRSYGTLLDY
jgi:WD40 repeat protein